MLNVVICLQAMVMNWQFFCMDFWPEVYQLAGVTKKCVYNFRTKLYP